MRSRFTRILAGTLIAGSLALAAPVAQASTIAELSIEQMTDVSTWIVRGKVVDTWTELDDRGYVWTRARVQVDQAFKGLSPKSEVIVDSLGGTWGDVTTDVPGRAEFSKGEEMLVFLAEIGKDARLVPVAKFHGKLSIRRAPGESRSYGMRWHPDRAITFDARFLPHPAPASRIYIDDVEKRILSRLESGWDGEDVPGIRREDIQKINARAKRLR